MNMVKPLVAALLLTVAGSTFAVQKDITITANVDANIDMTMADGTALPKSIEMQYLPGTGLEKYSIGMTKIWSNAVKATDGDVKMKLVSPAQLTTTAGDATVVPLTVKWGSDELTNTKDLDLKTSDIFPNGDDALLTGSVAKELTFEQTTAGELGTNTYQGVVSIYLYQAAAAAA